MTDKDKKIAEEILVNREIIYEDNGQWLFNEDVIYRNFVRIFTEAMQAYHEAANKQITDEDIEALVDEYFPNSLQLQWIETFKSGVRTGMKFMRGGKIKPVSRDNDC